METASSHLIPSNPSQSIADLRRSLRQSLTPKYGDREAAAMSRIIMMSLKDWDLNMLLANEEREAGEYLVGRSREILKALLEDVPLQYALGQTNFYGLKLKVAPGVLIPRPETEELVDLIIRENPQSDLRVLDLCTGSGAIALALARNLKFAEVEGIDISPDALQIAAENKSSLKSGVRFSQADVFKLSLPDEAYDIMVSNPPYVDESEKAEMEPNVLKYEPQEAIFVPDDNPLIFYNRIVSLADRALKPGGRLYLEINPRHAKEISALLSRSGFVEVELIKDVHGKDRFAKAQKPEEK